MVFCFIFWSRCIDKATWHTPTELNTHNQNPKLEHPFWLSCNYSIYNGKLPFATFLKRITQILFLKKHINLQGFGESLSLTYDIL